MPSWCAGSQGYEADELEAGELIKPHIHHLRQKLEPEPTRRVISSMCVARATCSHPMGEQRRLV